MARTLAWLGVALATVTLAAASAAQDEPPGPAFASTYRYQFTPNFGRSLRFCASQLASEPSNRRTHSLVLDLLSNPFLPPLDTPTDRFQAPPGWSWQPDSAGNSWLASSPTPMPLNQEHCFFLPVTRRVGFGDIARIVAEDEHRNDLYYFTSQQVALKPKRGELPLVYTLPQQDVTATFTSPSSACGLVRNFTTGLKIGVNRGLGTIVEPRTGDTVKGTVNPKTYTFKFTGSTEVYAGGIKGLVAWASYGYTRIFGGQSCTAGYLARINLNQPGRATPACRRPAIVAPARIPFRPGAFRIRVGASCAGKFVSGIRVTASLRFGDGLRTRLRAFETIPAPAQMTLRQFTPEQYEKVREAARRSPVKLNLRAPAQRGLQPATDVADLFFPPRR